MYFSKRLAWHISTPVFIDSGNGRGGIFDPSFISLLQLSLSLVSDNTTGWIYDGYFVAVV